MYDHFRKTHIYERIRKKTQNSQVKDQVFKD